MFRCLDCKHEFEEPEEVQEYRGEYWGVPAYERLWVCPVCGCDDIEEIERKDEDEREDDLFYDVDSCDSCTVQS